jgi:hypothetical protein
VTHPRAVRTTVVVVASAVYAWVAAGQRPFTLAEEVMVAIPAAAVLMVAVIRPSWSRSDAARGSTGPWIVLAGVALAWELIAFFSSPRHDHPTMSTIADEIMSVHAGRAVVFFLWLALGWSLVTRPHPDRA